MDKSDFKSDWNLSRGLSELLEKELQSKYNLVEKYEVDKWLKESNISLIELLNKENLIKIGNFFDCSYIILGEIKQFKIDKIGVYASPSGGVKTFYVQVQLNISIFDVENKKNILLNKIFEQKITNSKLIFTFLGIPDPKDTKMNEFFRLKKMYFGSEEFKQTLVFQAIDVINKKIVEEINKFIISDKIIEGIILYRDKNEIYINLGFLDQIKESDEMFVYNEGKKIGILKIDLIKSDKLSRAIIVKENEEIKKNCIIKNK
ncbi:MAG: hypothetical protein ABIB46_01635 [bacterium]